VQGPPVAAGSLSSAKCLGDQFVLELSIPVFLVCTAVSLLDPFNESPHTTCPSSCLCILQLPTHAVRSAVFHGLQDRRFLEKGFRVAYVVLVNIYRRGSSEASPRIVPRALFFNVSEQALEQSRAL